jgi:DNA/RNA-binding domain of Phe-tRNA-synthetase-like protein
MRIDIAENIKGKLSAVFIAFSGLRNTENCGGLWADMDNLASQIRAKYSSPVDALVLFKNARQLYKNIGIDPTKLRPSSEALTRRILQDKPLYRVNTLVDAGNYCSIHYQLPIGFYDLDAIEGDVVLRLGGAGEGYYSINKGWINIEGRSVLADERGLFGNPSSDSDRSKVTLATTNALFCIFAPAGVSENELAAHTEFTKRCITKYAQGIAAYCKTIR